MHFTTLVSTHETSDGVISYFRCECGAWEVRTADHGNVATTSTPPESRQVITV
ncbi:MULTISPECIES: hypothetical protein [unclassified Nonomuraea]